MKNVVRLHGVPRSIQSDLSVFWSELFRLLGTKMAMGQPIILNQMGQTEVLNKCIETYLMCFSLNPETGLIGYTELNFGTTLHINHQLK